MTKCWYFDKLENIILRSRQMLKKLDHIGIAVDDLDNAISCFEGVLGVKVQHREIVESEKIEAAIFNVGDTRIELFSPISEDSSVKKFLDRRGPGLHHIAFEVENIQAALAAARESGAQVLDEHPRVGVNGTLAGFIHPKSLFGVLTELVEYVQ
jgi:methylmalonyl-CoA/ethylmalonyl-CoA epimerase